MSSVFWLGLEPAAKASNTLATIMCIACAAGFYPRPKGLLTSAFLKDLSACFLHIFEPYLLMSTFAQATTLRPLEAAFCVTWGCVFTAINFGLGVAFAPLAAPDRAFSNTFKLLVTFPNSAAMPLLFMTSLVRIPAIGGVDGHEKAFAKSVQYIYMYGLSWTFLIWTLGLELTKHDAAQVQAAKAALALATARITTATATGNDTRATTGTTSSAPRASPAITFFLALKSAFMNPPVIGLLLGCVIGFWEWLRVALFAGGMLSGIGDVLRVLGTASVPSAMIILAGSIFGGLCDLVNTARVLQGAQPLPSQTSGWIQLQEAVLVLWTATRRTFFAANVTNAHSPLTEDGVMQQTEHEQPEQQQLEGEGTSQIAPSRAAVVSFDRQPAITITASPSTVWLADAAEKEEREKKAIADSEEKVKSAAAAAVVVPPATTLCSSTAAIPISLRTAGTLFLVRLVIAPAVCFLTYVTAQSLKLPVVCADSVDANAQLVVLIEAAMPSAQTILMLINFVGNEAAAKSAALLFVAQYPLALISTTAFIALALSIVK